MFKLTFRNNTSFPVSSLYKGESQERSFPGDWKKRRYAVLSSPCHVAILASCQVREEVPEGVTYRKDYDYRLKVGRCIRSVRGTVSSGFPALRHAARPPTITNALNPCSRNRYATRALVASRGQVQYR
jgi:hypothetical protein